MGRFEQLLASLESPGRAVSRAEVHPPNLRVRSINLTGCAELRHLGDIHRNILAWYS